MKKKSGSAGSLVPPVAPAEAIEADAAKPGLVEPAKAAQRQSGTGKYGSVDPRPFVPPTTPDAWEGVETSWVSVELVDDADRPVPGEVFEVTVGDGRVYRGTTDHEGKGRVPGIPVGDCRVCFPNLDQDAWEEL